MKPVDHIPARTPESRHRIITRLFNELQAHLSDAADADVTSINSASLIHMASSVDSLHHDYADIVHTLN